MGDRPKVDRASNLRETYPMQLLGSKSVGPAWRTGIEATHGVFTRNNLESFGRAILAAVA
jgi:hypothetical protein